MLFIHWKVAMTFQSQDMKMLITRKWVLKVVPPVLLTTESMVFFKEGDEQNENSDTE